MPDSSEPQPVLFQEVATASGHRIGVAQLDAPKSLNALSLAMIRLLDRQLRAWADDPQIVCVMLHGAGERAFCAGGDVRGLYAAIREHGATATNPATLAFFSEEYRLDHRIHTFAKPVVVWGSGIVMGGGLGLFAGASHRVVTETSRIAMPEISIGLFPDVGGSWFLRRMPRRVGLFVALTGVPLNAHDAMIAGLGDHFLQSAARDELIARLAATHWQDTAAANRLMLSEVLGSMVAPATELPAANLLRHAGTIDALTGSPTLTGVVERIRTYRDADEWLLKGAKTLLAGSPTTAALIWELRRRAEGLALAEAFRMELIVALQCCAHPDFAEGIRALLIDKDNSPCWTPEAFTKVTPEWVAEHFAAPPWPGGVHPLHDLAPASPEKS